MTTGFGDKVLALHNNYREKHGAGPLAWSEELEKTAVEIASSLLQNPEVNLPLLAPNSPVGHNIYEYEAKGQDQISDDEALEDAIHSWYEDVSNYDSANPTASKGGSFSQLLWKSTLKVGMTIVRKQDGDSTNIVVLALYDPPGNCSGQFESNVCAQNPSSLRPAKPVPPPLDTPNEDSCTATETIRTTPAPSETPSNPQVPQDLSVEKTVKKPTDENVENSKNPAEPVLPVEDTTQVVSETVEGAEKIVDAQSTTTTTKTLTGTAQEGDDLVSMIADLVKNATDGADPNGTTTVTATIKGPVVEGQDLSTILKEALVASGLNADVATDSVSVGNSSETTTTITVGNDEAQAQTAEKAGESEAQKTEPEIPPETEVIEKKPEEPTIETISPESVPVTPVDLTQVPVASEPAQITPSESTTPEKADEPKPEEPPLEAAPAPVSQEPEAKQETIQEEPPKTEVPLPEAPVQEPPAETPAAPAEVAQNEEKAPEVPPQEQPAETVTETQTEATSNDQSDPSLVQSEDAPKVVEAIAKVLPEPVKPVEILPETKVVEQNIPTAAAQPEAQVLEVATEAPEVKPEVPEPMVEVKPKVSEPIVEVKKQETPAPAVPETKKEEKVVPPPVPIPAEPVPQKVEVVAAPVKPDVSIIPLTREALDLAVQLHNDHRRKHGAPSAKIDPKLCEEAKNHAKSILLSEDPPKSGEKLGVSTNVYHISSPIEDPQETIKKAVEEWYSKIGEYNWASPMLSPPTTHPACQVIWASSRKLGVAMASADPSTSVLVILYTPPANFTAEKLFRANVRQDLF